MSNKGNKDGSFRLEDLQIGHATTGNTHTVAAGATTAVFTNTTFDGSIGSTGFTAGDIVAAPKRVGILAQ